MRGSSRKKEWVEREPLGVQYKGEKREKIHSHSCTRGEKREEGAAEVAVL